MSLYQYQKDGNVEALLQTLAESDSGAVRRRAAKILGQLELETEESTDDVVEQLVTVARDDDDKPVRAAAIDALDKRGPDAVEKFLAATTDYTPGQDGADWVRAEAFVAALDKEPPELRMAAASVLGHIGDPKAVDPLIERFEDGDPRVRSRTAMALGRIGHPKAIDALKDRASDPAPQVRREAAEALGAIGVRQCYDPLTHYLDDQSASVRRVAVAAMGRIATVGGVEDVVDLVSDDNEEVRRAAAFSLLELLSNAPTQRSHEIRNEIVDQLVADDTGEIVALLSEIVEEATEAAQRRNAAWVLGRITDEDRVHRAVRALVDLLGDDDEMTSNIATTSLAAIGGDSVEDALLDVVDSDAPSEKRANAVFTLGKVGGEQSRQRLDTLVDETEDKQVREQAFSALSRLGGR